MVLGNLANVGEQQMAALRNLRQFIRMQERKLALKCTDEHTAEIVQSEQARLSERDKEMGDVFHLLSLEEKLGGLESGVDYIPTPRM